MEIQAIKTLPFICDEHKNCCFLLDFIKVSTLGVKKLALTIDIVDK